MAYSFWAERYGNYDSRAFRDAMREFRSVEFFPVEVSDERLVIGISVPFMGVSAPRFERDVEGAIRFLITDAGFLVFDLFTGNEVTLADVPGLAQRISG